MKELWQHILKDDLYWIDCDSETQLKYMMFKYNTSIDLNSRVESAPAVENTQWKNFLWNPFDDTFEKTHDLYWITLGLTRRLLLKGYGADTMALLGGMLNKVRSDCHNDYDDDDDEEQTQRSCWMLNKVRSDCHDDC